MKKTKFYALLTGSKKELQQKMERTFDKKSKKFFSLVTEQEVKRPTTILIPLDGAKTRAEANREAQHISKTMGMPLQGVHVFK